MRSEIQIKFERRECLFLAVKTVIIPVSKKLSFVFTGFNSSLLY